MKTIGHIKIVEPPTWQDAEQSLQQLEFTILRKLKRKVWDLEMVGSGSRVEIAKAKQLVSEFEASIKKRKAAWKNHGQKCGAKVLINLMNPKLLRFIDYVEGKCS